MADRETAAGLISGTLAISAVTAASAGGCQERTARANQRRAKRAHGYRERIFHAAIALFAERGLQHVTVEQITERAEVGKGTFFNYFDNKEAVLSDFINEEVHRLREAVATSEVTGTPSQRILQLILILARQPQFTREFVRGLFMAGLSATNFSEREGRGVWDLRGILAEIVREGQENGEFRAVPTAPEAGIYLLGQYHLAMLTWCSGFSEDTLDRTVERYVELGLRAIKTSP